MKTSPGSALWVRFTSDFDFKPTPQSTVAYKAGMVANVTRACATLAVVAGKAVRIKRDRKDAGAEIDNGRR